MFFESIIIQPFLKPVHFVLYDTYNGDYMIALCNIVNAIKDAIVTDVERARAITEERMINFKYYEYYNIFKGHLEE